MLQPRQAQPTAKPRHKLHPHHPLRVPRHPLPAGAYRPRPTPAARDDKFDAAQITTMMPWLAPARVLSRRLPRLGRRLELTNLRNQLALQKHFTPNIGAGDHTVVPISQTLHNTLKPVVPLDVYISCTTFNSHGAITAVLKRFAKMKFLRDNNLHPRDLRNIDTSSIDVSPTIMIRDNNAILINLLHIKAIVKADQVMVFDTSTDIGATRLGLFMYDLEMKLKTPYGNLPYEFRAVETILINIMTYMEDELRTQVRDCTQILHQLEDQVDRTNLQELLVKLKKLASFYQKATLITNVLDDVLENDDDLAGMYLSRPPPENKDYDDLEMILETYLNQCDEIVQHAGSLLSDIKATEEIANIILDANRNQLMLFELKVTLYTLGFTVATLVPAFYGMNLKNYIEDTNWGFGAVVVLLAIQGIVITVYNFRKLRAVQRLTMMQLRPAQNLVMSPHTTRGRWYRLLFGRLATLAQPSKREGDALWRMINDDKRM